MIDGEYLIEDFWDPADGNNWSPAIMRAQLLVPLWTPLRLYIGNRLYRLDQRIDIIRPHVTISGLKPGNGIVSSLTTTTAGVPTLYWPNAGSCGIDVSYPGRYNGGTYGTLVVAADANARGSSFKMHGLSMNGPGGSIAYLGNIDDHAINIHSPVELVDCSIRGFRGHGIFANASATSTVNLGNINSSVFRNLSIYSTGGPAIEIAGGDANQIVIDGVNVNECGLDALGREAAFNVLLAGVQLHMVTITAAVNSTLYRLVVSGNNCDYTSDASATTSEIVDGLVSAVTAAAIANVAVARIDSTRLLIYGTNTSTFTCTETSANMTISSTAPTTTPSSVHCLGGPTTHPFSIGDMISVYTPTIAWRGCLRGDTEDVGEGYVSVSLRMDSTGYSNPATQSISNVSGTTWRITNSQGRAWTSREHNNRQIVIAGSSNPNNDGSFTISRIVSGVGSGTRIRVLYAAVSSRYWVYINDTEVSFTSAASPTITSVRDQFISAINAAAIPGVTASIHDADEIALTGSPIVGFGPWIDNVGGTGATWIEYTNASGVAEASFPGTWSIVNRVAVQGYYSIPGTFYARERGCQLMDHPLIASTWKNCLINGPSTGDGYVANGGYSTFHDCYTEGLLQSVVLPPAQIRGGSMNPILGSKTERVNDNHILYSVLKVSYLHGGGATRGVLGDAAYSNAAFGWEYDHPTVGDVWRMMKAETAQGVGLWELILNPGTTRLVTMRIGALDNTRIGVGSLATGQPGLFINHANGTLPNPRSAIPNGANSATTTDDDANVTGATGYLEWHQNSNYSVFFEVSRVYSISGLSAATPAVVTIGTHNIPSGQRGRCVIRNVQGMTGANALHQWTYAGPSTLNLQDTSGANRTTTGTYVGATGILIMGRAVAYGDATFSGGALSLSTGSWVAGDRFVHVNAQSGESLEWVCTTTGTGTSAAWARVGLDVGDRPNGELYISTPAATAITAANTPILLAGTTTLVTGGTLFDMPSNGRLRYYNGGSATTAETRRFRITASLTVSPEIAAEIGRFAIRINGTEQTASIQRVSMGAAGNLSNVKLELIATLAATDYVEVYVANETSAGDITADRMVLTVVAL